MTAGLFLLLTAGCHGGKLAQAARASNSEEASKDASKADARKPTLNLTVQVGGERGLWTPAQLQAAPQLAVSNKNGEQRSGWSLHELAHRYVGPNARVVAVVGEKQRAEVSRADWQTDGKELVLRVTGGGEYKAQWVEKSGKGGAAVMKGVSGLEIEP